jgi:hypothetical protein
MKQQVAKTTTLLMMRSVVKGVKIIFLVDGVRLWFLGLDGFQLDRWIVTLLDFLSIGLHYNITALCGIRYSLSVKCVFSTPSA